MDMSGFTKEEVKALLYLINGQYNTFIDLEEIEERALTPQEEKERDLLSRFSATLQLELDARG